MRGLAGILYETVSQFWEGRAPRMAAALAYYATFSLAPLLIIAVAIAGVAFGQDAAQGRIVGQIQSLIGPSGAQTIQDLISNARKPTASAFAAAVGIITLLVGATGVVGELQDSLNAIWNVKPVGSTGLFGMVKRRVASFAMIVGIGFILLVSLVLSTLLSAATSWAADLVTIPDALVRLVDVAFSVVAIGVLFGLIYKVVPDAEIRWRDVLEGAAAASLMFAIGKMLLSYYIAHSSLQSTYGAAGSFVVLLLWVYYSAQILFFGAELTQICTRRRRPVAASEGAVKTVAFRPQRAAKRR